MTDFSQEIKTQTPAPTLIQRRGLLLSAAAAATVAGAGLAWWRNAASGGGESVAALVPGFWSMEWDQPQGGKLPAAGFQGRPLLINFWATWCPPCVEELPLINGFYNENKAKGFQVLALAVDRMQAVQNFLRASPLDFSIGVAGMAGSDLATALGDKSGSLPFSVLLGADGRVFQRKLGRLTPADLQQWLTLK
jgi:thiol-disulfide isomerase/thioredoxin